MSTPWLPNGRLKDGTYLFGPYQNKKAEDTAPTVDIIHNGTTYHVRYNTRELTEEQRKAIHEYAIHRIAKAEEKAKSKKEAERSVNTTETPPDQESKS